MRIGTFAKGESQIGVIILFFRNLSRSTNLSPEYNNIRDSGSYCQQPGNPPGGRNSLNLCFEGPWNGKYYLTESLEKKEKYFK